LSIPCRTGRDFFVTIFLEQWRSSSVVDALHLMMRRQNKEGSMTAAESKGLKKGSRVYWRGDAADRGSITEMSWDAVTIAWDNGQVARVHHGDMREIQQAPAKPVTV
jgi:preprotein translocase subunit YajC